jgi:AcrR family transcriptional regulator
MMNRASRPTRKAKSNRTQEERTRATRSKILDATIRSLVELGYAGTTLGIVAGRAKVTIGAVQHHFRTRDDLFAAVMTERIGELLLAVEPVDRERLSVAERVRVACDRYWKTVNSSPYVAGMSIILGASHDALLRSKIAPVMAEAQKTLDDQWSELFLDLDIPSETTSAIRHVAMAAFRGFALRQLQSSAKYEWIKERDVLVQMLAFALKKGSDLSR